jgi:hypothetical protein
MQWVISAPGLTAQSQAQGAMHLKAQGAMHLKT